MSQCTRLLWICQSGTLLHPCIISVGNTPPLPMWHINRCCKLLGEVRQHKPFFLPGSLISCFSPVSTCFHSQLLFTGFCSSRLHLNWILSPVVWADSLSLHRDRRGGYPGYVFPSSDYLSPLHWIQIRILDYLTWIRSFKSQSHVKILFLLNFCVTSS